jgi:hypothetical protein
VNQDNASEVRYNAYLATKPRITKTINKERKTTKKKKGKAVASNSKRVTWSELRTYAILPKETINKNVRKSFISFVIVSYSGEYQYTK